MFASFYRATNEFNFAFAGTGFKDQVPVLIFRLITSATNAKSTSQPWTNIINSSCANRKITDGFALLSRRKMSAEFVEAQGGRALWTRSSSNQLSPLPAKPRTRIALHIHMDGAARPETVWELSKLKGFPLPGDGSLKALKDAIVCTSPSTLCHFLDGFKWMSPVFVDDLEAVERLAYETCEDMANDGVLYCELRYSPHYMISGKCDITAADVVASSLAGLKRGELEFFTKARLILCCMRSIPERAKEIVELCDRFRNDGVVGIDLAGDEAADVDVKTGIEKFNPLFIEAFEEAARRGIPRTAHAGEAGPANAVETAMDRLDVQRIGHGYHVVTDAAIYEKAKDLNVHFETCPYSSILTGAVPKDCPKHPIVRFAEEGVNFSVSTDDPTITSTTLTNEYQLLRDWGLTEAHIVQANFNALQAAFLPKEEIAELEIRLKENMNVSEL